MLSTLSAVLITAAAVAETPVEVVAYKGFDKNMQCRGFQYEVGKTYVHTGSVVQCESGFHVCQNPFDVLDFYGLGDGNRFARVTIGGSIDRSDDKKWAAGELTIGVELMLPDFIKAAIDWIVAAAKGGPDDRVQAASGDSSQLAASGDSSQLAASGPSSKLAASGDSSQLAASGHYSQLAASGHSSQLAASGPSSKLAASGPSSQLAASGPSSKLAASGHYSKLAASGDSSQLAASGDSSQLAASGPSSKLAASGPSSQLAASGPSSKLAASGPSSQLEITGKNSAAACVGPNGSIKAVEGTPVSICEYNRNGNPLRFVSGIAGQDGVPADTWLIAKAGKLVAA